MVYIWPFKFYFLFASVVAEVLAGRLFSSVTEVRAKVKEAHICFEVLKVT